MDLNSQSEASDCTEGSGSWREVWKARDVGTSKANQGCVDKPENQNKQINHFISFHLLVEHKARLKYHSKTFRIGFNIRGKIVKLIRKPSDGIGGAKNDNFHHPSIQFLMSSSYIMMLCSLELFGLKLRFSIVEYRQHRSERKCTILPKAFGHLPSHKCELK